MKTVLKVLETIILVPLCFIGGLIVSVFVGIFYIFTLPFKLASDVVVDLWED